MPAFFFFSKLFLMKVLVILYYILILILLSLPQVSIIYTEEVYMTPDTKTMRNMFGVMQQLTCEKENVEIFNISMLLYLKLIVKCIFKVSRNLTSKRLFGDILEVRLLGTLFKLKAFMRKEEYLSNTAEAWNSFWLKHFWTQFCFATR